MSYVSDEACRCPVMRSVLTVSHYEPECDLQIPGRCPFERFCEHGSTTIDCETVDRVVRGLNLCEEHPSIEGEIVFSMIDSPGDECVCIGDSMELAHMDSPGRVTLGSVGEAVRTVCFLCGYE